MKPPKKLIDSKEVTYCLCRRPYRKSDGAMIGCDGPCKDWYHFKCIKIPNSFISRATWYCQQCYLIVTDDQVCFCGSGWKANAELLQCKGKCEKWFHLQCLKLEVALSDKDETWRKICQNWECSLCAKSELQKNVSHSKTFVKKKSKFAPNKIHQSSSNFDLKNKNISGSFKMSQIIVAEILDKLLNELCISNNNTIEESQTNDAITNGRLRISPTSKLFESVNSLLDYTTKTKRIVIPPKRFLDEGNSISIPFETAKSPGKTGISITSNLQNKEKIYCICQKPYTKSDSAMIGCDGPCGEWFHFKCIGIPDHFVSRAKWFCKDCFYSVTGTGEACICGGIWRPDQELLQCQGECQIWYHPQCKKLDTEFSTKLGTWKRFSKTWKCNLCSKTNTA